MGWASILVVKRNLVLVRLRGIAGLQCSRRRTAGGPQYDQQNRHHRQTSRSSEPAHENYPRLREFDKEVATRLPHTISLNQRLGDSTFEGECRFFQVERSKHLRTIAR